MNEKVKKLPFQFDFETKKVLKKLPSVHASLAELKGIGSTIPNQSILINTLTLQEAKDSSEIENIVTSHDELYKSNLALKNHSSLAAKEVQNYTSALKEGFELVKKEGFLTNKTILKIQQKLEQNDAGFRKLPGTALINSSTGETIYTPPQNPDEIAELMNNLELFINNNELSDLDPLVKLSIIHYQFETIHPFYDGNGRTGRIISILYLIINNLQDLPILYLSNYIIKNKNEYYQLLQQVREKNSWEEWILYILNGLEITAKETIKLIKEIKNLMQQTKITLRNNYKFYSQDLINNLFNHPYTKIDFLTQELKISRVTASDYLNKMSSDGLLKKEKTGNSNYYINSQLVDLLTKR